MKIVTLLENDSIQKTLQSAHGLSLYIETNKTKILFDIGPNNYYIKNAKKLNVRLEDIDLLVISHGHYDHGTGLKQFLKLNHKAQIYISENAFGKHVKNSSNKLHDIGIGKEPKSSRIHYISNDRITLEDSIYITDQIEFKEQIIQDENLMVLENNNYVKDHFDHELYMIIDNKDKTVLFSGCSHKGIEHIVDSLEHVFQKRITHVIGGLHFSKYDAFNLRQTDYLQKLGKKFLEEKKLKLYACHCTGEDAFFELQRVLKTDIIRIKTGSTIEL